MPANILVVDDDPRTRESVRLVLEQQGGHQIQEAADARVAELLVRSARPDLILMDVALPGTDDFALCKRIRVASNVPIIIVSARGDITSRVHGLRLGADDDIVKPFDASELSARVEAVLRRSARAPGADTDGRLHVGDLTLDLGEHRVEIRSTPGASTQVQLAPTEFKILLLLARSPGQAISREDLQAVLWGPSGVDPVAGYNTVNSYISELRTHLEVDPHHPRYLVTVRKLGYKLMA